MVYVVGKWYQHIVVILGMPVVMAIPWLVEQRVEVSTSLQWGIP